MEGVKKDRELAKSAVVTHKSGAGQLATKPFGDVGGPSTHTVEVVNAVDADAMSAFLVQIKNDPPGVFAMFEELKAKLSSRDEELAQLTEKLYVATSQLQMESASKETGKSDAAEVVSRAAYDAMEKQLSGELAQHRAQAEAHGSS